MNNFIYFSLNFSVDIEKYCKLRLMMKKKTWCKYLNWKKGRRSFLFVFSLRITATDPPLLNADSNIFIMLLVFTCRPYEIYHSAWREGQHVYFHKKCGNYYFFQSHYFQGLLFFAKKCCAAGHHIKQWFFA